jgi:hypothetical protein
MKGYNEDLDDLNELEEVLRVSRRQYEENGMNVLSDTEDGYKSCGSSISDKTYLNFDKKSRRYPSVLIDLIDIEKK